jgi:nucleoside-diphosphate-sugar epimerase
MGRNRKSLAYLDNLVDALLGLWRREGSAGVEIYNYADKPDLSSAEIIAEIRAGLGRQGPGIRLPLGLALLGALPFEVLGNLLGKDLGISRNRIHKLAEVNSVVAADRVQQACGAPRIPLTEGLRRTLAWYVAEGRGRTPVRRIPPEHASPLQPAR